MKVSEAYKANARKKVSITETASGWQLYESKTGGYKIAFPEIPAEGKTALDSETGKLDVYSAIHYTDEALYVATYMDYPDLLINSETIDLEKYYTGVIEDAVANINGKILSIKSIMLDEIVEGREIRISDKSQTVVVVLMRVFLVANRRYMFQTIGDKGIDDHELTKRFMDSFELIEKF